MSLKSAIRGVAVLLIGTVLLYLAGAFVAGGFDTTQWDATGKLLMLPFWFLVVCTAADLAADGSDLS